MMRFLLTPWPASDLFLVAVILFLAFVLRPRHSRPRGRY